MLNVYSVQRLWLPIGVSIATFAFLASIFALIVQPTQARPADFERHQDERLVNTCFATHDDGTTVQATTDSQALQVAIDLALAAGGNPTVKVAGTCDGSALTTSANNPTPVGLITGSLTVRGGYTSANSIADATVAEGEIVTLTISMDSVRDTDTTMQVTTADKTATGQSTARTTFDYVHFAQSNVTIPAGQLSTTVSIQTLDDPDVEGQETFSVTLSNLARANISFAKATAVVIITEDDSNATSNSSTVTPETGVTLGVNQSGGGSGTQTVTTTVNVPAGAVSDTVTYVYTDIQTETVDAGFNFVGEHFSIEAHVNGVAQDRYMFAATVTTTMHYSDSALDGMREETLIVQYWTGSDWIDAAATCYNDDPNQVPSNAYVRDMVNNILQVQICHLTEFALFAQPSTRYVYLPIVFGRPETVAPDLTITSLSITSSGIEMTIKNSGIAANTSGFWVDLYINPSPAPTGVNETFLTNGGNGTTWAVALVLSPDESVTLRLGDAYHLSDAGWNGGALAAGTTVYAQVDSAGDSTSYGAVEEQHEIDGDAYNNITMTTLATTVNVSSGRSIGGVGFSAEFVNSPSPLAAPSTSSGALRP